MSFTQNSQQLAPNALITLYKLELNHGAFYFHGMNEGQIVWQGDTYTPVAVQSDGLEMRGDGRASTPKLTLANSFNGVAGGLSALCLLHGDFAGAKLSVIYTFLENDGTLSTDFRQNIWYVEQKVEETHAFISFELSNPIDFEGKKIPVRQITGFCHWALIGQYRGEACGYTGTKCYTKDGTPCSAAQDACGGRLYDCKLRFGDTPLPFGGFPASVLI